MNNNLIIYFFCMCCLVKWYLNINEIERISKNCAKKYKEKLIFYRVLSAKRKVLFLRNFFDLF